MTSILLTRNDEGKLAGVGEKHAKAWAKLRTKLEGLEPGEIVELSHWFPRSLPMHKRHFAILAAVYDMQEQFTDAEHLRLWAQVGAGFCDFVPGPNGRMVALPQSIAFRSMDDADFLDHHERVVAFLRSPQATQFLWGHLPLNEQSNMVESVLQGFNA